MPPTLSCLGLADLGVPPFRRLPPAQPHGKSNPERQKTRTHCCLSPRHSCQRSRAESPLLLPGPARNSLTESPHENPPAQQRGTDSQKARMHRCFSPHNSRQHSLTDSQKAHMHCFLSLHNSHQHSLADSCCFRHPPGQACRKSTCTEIYSCVVCDNRRQHTLRESPLLFPTPAKDRIRPGQHLTERPPLLLRVVKTKSDQDSLTESKHAMKSTFLPFVSPKP